MVVPSPLAILKIKHEFLRTRRVCGNRGVSSELRGRFSEAKAVARIEVFTQWFNFSGEQRETTRGTPR